MILRVRPHLQEITSLRLGGYARCILIPESDGDYLRIPRYTEQYGGRPVILGRGTNILAEDGEHELVLVQRPCLADPEVLEGESYVPSGIAVAVDAGMSLSRLTAWCIRHGWSGLEPLAGIPGNVGGAVAMNAGSHGQECCGLLTRIRVWTPERGVHWVTRSQCAAGYRNFRLRGHEGVFAVLGAVFLFTRKSSRQVREETRSWFMRKKSVQPLGAHTAGCVFKNPPEGSAGMLLDRAGFRGRHLGGMRFSPVHANFLENTGNGTSAQARELMTRAVREVSERFGIHLDCEVEVVACR